jgi:anti-sigma factor RsiW
VDLPTIPKRPATEPVASHEAAFELAATWIDFDLSPSERRALDRHLVACAPCRQTAEALREDARAIAALPRP